MTARPLSLPLATLLVLCHALGCGSAAGPESPSQDPQAPPPVANGAHGLRLTSDAPRLRIVRGSSATIDVVIERSGGLEGEIDITLSDLPTGVSAKPVVVPAEKTGATIVFEASDSAPHAGPVVSTVSARASRDHGVASRLELPTYVAGGAGVIDESFGGSGTVDYSVTADPDFVHDGMLDGRGRVVVSGYGYGMNETTGWLTRFMPDGTLDSTFGNAGAIIGFGQTSSEARQLLPSEDGFVVVLRRNEGNSQELSIRRYRADSTLDATYGNGGDAPVPGPGLATDFARRGSGVVYHSSISAFAFDAHGQADATFAPQSKIHMWSADGDPQGRVVFGASSGDSALMLMRVGQTGEADETFGDLGYASFPTPANHVQAILHDVVLEADGSGYAGGSSTYEEPGGDEAAIVHFDAAGKPVIGFGDAGKIVVEARGAVAHLAIDDDGRVLALIHRSPKVGPADFVVRRYLHDGKLDGSFGTAGQLTLADDGARRMLYDRTAGRIVIVGEKPGGGIRLVRVWL